MGKIRKILVPLDGSKNSLRALDAAISLAKDSNAAITALHVIRFPIQFSNKIKKQHKKLAEKIMILASRTAKKSKVNLTPIIRFDGYVGDQIVKYAHLHKFDLIVIGSRGPNPIAEMFLGSVANYVLNKSKIPVLLIK
ncbi:MAG: universal stress protein [Candidatus Nitrosotenuis sp.]